MLDQLMAWWKARDQQSDMDVGTKFYGNQLTHFTKNQKCQPQGGAREKKISLDHQSQ